MTNIKIDFPEKSSALGRNGTMQTIAINILVNDSHLLLTPINTKNNLGRCVISIPKDLNVVQQLINMLQTEEAALILQHETAKVPFDTLPIGASFDWRKLDDSHREFIKINSEQATPKGAPEDIWRFLKDCEVQPWPCNLKNQAA